MFMLLSNFVFSQVYSNRPIELTSTGDSSRVQNLHTPDITNAGINVKSAQSNKYLYGAAVGIDSIKLSLPIDTIVFAKGMIVYFKSTGVNTDSVIINLNNSSYYSLYKNIREPLSPGDIKSGQMIAAGFDGTNFQFLNYESYDCPTDFLPVTDEYCIEINESITADTFYLAVVNCYNKNARMCNWGEWNYACNSLGVSLNNMTNNWEYTDDPGNEVNMVRICGNGNCNASGLQSIPTNAPKKYRCCYSRK